MLLSRRENKWPHSPEEMLGQPEPSWVVQPSGEEKLCWILSFRSQTSRDQALLILRKDK